MATKTNTKSTISWKTSILGFNSPVKIRLGHFWMKKKENIRIANGTRTETPFNPIDAIIIIENSRNDGQLKICNKIVKNAHRNASCVKVI